MPLFHRNGEEERRTTTRIQQPDKEQRSLNGLELSKDGDRPKWRSRWRSDLDSNAPLGRGDAGVRAKLTG